MKIDLLLPRGQNPLSYHILYNESKHKYPCLGRQGQQNQSYLKFDPDLYAR